MFKIFSGLENNNRVFNKCLCNIKKEKLDLHLLFCQNIKGFHLHHSAYVMFFATLLQYMASVMSTISILEIVYGARLADMIFMEKGCSMMEMFQKY